MEERVEQLRERNAKLASARDEARAKLERALRRVGEAGEQAEEAKRRLEQAERMHVRSMAGSEGPEEGTLEEAEQVLEDARKVYQAAEADRVLAADAVEELMRKEEHARRELSEGATRAKVEVVNAALEEAREAWREVRVRLDEVVAVRGVAHGESPPVTHLVEPAARSFERTVFEGKPPSERERAGPAGRLGLAVLVTLTVVGAAAAAAAGVADWLDDRSGLDLGYRAFYGSDLGERLLQPSAGLIAILTAVLGLLGLVIQTAWLPRVAGALAIVGAALFIGNAARLDELSAVDFGSWMFLGGGVAMLLGGLAGSFRRTETR